MYGVATEPEFTFPLSSWPNNVCLHKLFFPYKHEEAHDDVIEYVRKGAVRLSDFYSHVLGMDEIEKGLELVASRKAFRVTIKIS